MDSGKNTDGKFLLYCLFRILFSSSFIAMVINVVIPIIISIYIAYNQDNLNIRVLGVYILIIIFYNVVSIWLSRIESKNKKLDVLARKSNNELNLINIETSTQIFRMNTHIWKKFENKKTLLKTEICEFINFQKHSFLVCKSIYLMLKNEYTSGRFTVTIHRRFSDDNNNDFMKMIAYENNNSKIPSSYYDKFYINEPRNINYNFVRAALENDDDLIILEDKNSCRENFHLIDNSKKREKEVCQYIGIPIKMNNNKVQLVINIDVCSEKILGKSKKELTEMTEIVLVPYVSNLKLAYEYNVTFDKYFDLLERFCEKEFKCDEIKNEKA